MLRLATLLSLLIVPMAGCGSSKDDGDSGSPVAVAPAKQGADTAKKRASKPKAERRQADAKKPERSEEAEDGGDDDGEPLDEHEAQEKALADASPADRATLIRIAVQSALARFGLKLADLEVSRRGRSVLVVVTRKSACNAVAKNEAAMVQVIQEAAPIVKSVRFEVAGTHKELGYYVLSCSQPKMPDGAGKVVLERTGVGGPVRTKRFTIRGDRWALEYENAANFLAVIVVPVGGKSKGDYKDPISSDKREAGRQEYKGAGVYELRIQGGGLWTVRVKDIR